MKLTQKIFLAGVFLMPFIFNPATSVMFEIPRVWFFSRWVEALTVTVIFSAIKPFALRDKKMFTAIFVFIVWVTVVSLLGSDLAKSIFGNYFRKDGILILIHLGLFSFLVARFIDKETIEKTYSVFAIGSFVLGSSVIIQNILYYLFNITKLPNFYGVMGSTFGQPKFLAGYLCVTLPFVWQYGLKHTPSAKVFLAVITVAIILTRSWVAIFLVGIFFAYQFSLRIRSGKKKTLTFLLTASFFTLIFGGLYIKNYEKLQSRSMDGFIAESRTRIYYKGFLGFVQKPIAGWGWANFDYAFESSNWPMKIYHDVYVDKPHSHLLEVLVTSGIVGFALYSSIIYQVVRNLFKLRSLAFVNTLLISFVLFIVHSQTNVISISEEMIFWMILGISTRMDFGGSLNGV